MATRVYDIEEGAVISMSPSSAKLLDDCPAGYLYNKVILPKIADSKESEDITRVGTLFHDWAEHDFDPAKRETILEEASDDDIAAIVTYAQRVKSRPYFAEKSFEVERYVKHWMRDNEWLIRGYIDRIVKIGKVVHIIDYKTTWNPMPERDKRQLMIYAYILHKTEGIKAKNLKLMLDYVQEDMVETFDVTDEDLVLTGNYLMSVFLRAKSSIDAYQASQDMHSVYHRPGGSCTFCRMIGNCLAYKALMNPAFQDPAHDNDLSMEEMVEELKIRQEAVKINDARVTVLKRALMQRYDDIQSRNDISQRKAFESMCALRSRKDKYIRRDDLLSIVVPDLVKDSLKMQQLKGVLDTQKLEKKMAAVLETVLPETIKPSQVPESVLADNPNLVRTASRNKYLQVI